MHHTLSATPTTVRYGMLDARFPTTLRVESGDSVTVESVSGADRLQLPRSPVGKRARRRCGWMPGKARLRRRALLDDPSVRLSFDKGTPTDCIEGTPEGLKVQRRA